MPPRPIRMGSEGTFAWVLREFERSPAFTHNGEGTKNNHRYMIGWLEAVLGRYSTTDVAHGIRPKLVQAAIDTLADRPSQQINVLALLKVIDKWAAPREYLLRSITFGVQVIGREDSGHVPWTEPQVALACQHVAHQIPRAIKLMRHLGQRRSDIVRLRLNDIAYEENPLTGQRVPGIRLAQQKTGLGLWVPFDEEIADLIETWRPDIKRGGPPWLLVRKPDGQPYVGQQLAKAWEDERNFNPALRDIAELGYRTQREKRLVLHGLRGSCVVGLRKAGASVPMICSMVGMSEKMVMRYSRFADQVDLALAAVHKLGAGTAREQATPGKTGKTA